MRPYWRRPNWSGSGRRTPPAWRRSRRAARPSKSRRRGVVRAYSPGDPGSGRRPGVPHLPGDVIRAQEGEIDSAVPGRRGRVVHPHRPVLIVAGRDEAVVIEQAGAGQVGVDVRGVGDIVALLLEPGHIIDFIVEESAVAIEGDRPVE